MGGAWGAQEGLAGVLDGECVGGDGRAQECLAGVPGGLGSGSGTGVGEARRA